MSRLAMALIGVTLWACHITKADLLPKGAFHNLFGPQIIGTEARSGGPEAVCAVLLLDKAHNLKDICSGTLTSKQEVTTAAHCFLERQPNDVVAVGCGYGPDGKPKEMHLAQTVLIASAFNEARPADNDVAVIKLDKESGLNPIPALKETEIRDLFPGSRLVGSGECRIAGVGYSNGGEVPGTLFSAPVSDVEVFQRKKGVQINSNARGIFKTEEAKNRCLSLMTDSGDYQTLAIQIAKIVSTSTTLSAGVAAGDSGGPLFCRASPTSPWKLVAVLSAYSFDTVGSAILSELQFWSWPSVPMGVR